jgi:hypothetical protein
VTPQGEFALQLAAAVATATAEEEEMLDDGADDGEAVGAVDAVPVPQVRGNTSTACWVLSTPVELVETRAEMPEVTLSAHGSGQMQLDPFCL